MNFIAATLLASAIGINPTIGTPAEAVALAYADARQFAEPHWLRYIWVSGKPRDDIGDDIRVLSYALNLVSRSPVKSRPVPLTNGHVTILRVDTRLYAPVKEIDSFLTAWEDLKYDPKFSGLITQGSLKLAKLDPVGQSRKVTFRANGVAFIKEEEAKDVLKRDGVLRYRPPHVGQAWDALAALTRTEGPIIDYRYFIWRSMHAIQDKEKPLFATVFGGLYYDLAGIPTGKKNDLEELLKTLGVGDGKDFRKIFDDLRSDQRAAMFRSNVTGRMRLIELFKTLAGREVQGIFALTSDFGVADIDTDQSPIGNLLKVNGIKAHEAIWEKPNGLHGFVLYNGQFKRQDSAPDDVVHDFQQKPPHSSRLQPAFSCIRCHGKEDGWLPVHNDVKTMLSSRKIDIFGDLTAKNQQDAIDRIVGLYTGSFDNIFRRGRDDYALNILNVTGPWKNRDQLLIVKTTAIHMEKIIEEYYYKQVDAQQAMAEIGYDVDEKNAAIAFSAYVLKLTNNIVLEDPRVAALRIGISINRWEWDLIYGFLMK